MRVPQREGQKGSLKWIQGVAEHADHPVSIAIREQLRIQPEVQLRWLSPRRDDGFAEYRDGGALDLLGLSSLRPELSEFWPRNGPQWDALARTSEGQILLIEAKAHFSEMNSACAAGSSSRQMIQASLDQTKIDLGANPNSNWLSGFYQHANRLAHVKFLRSRGANAHLVEVFFLGDREMNGPGEIAGWAKALDDRKELMGLSETEPPFVHHVFVRVD